METALEILNKVAQSTAIPLFMTSVMTRCVRGPSKSPPRRQSQLAGLISLEDAFEPETAPIWDTQLPLLQLIQSTPFPGVRLSKLAASFSRYQTSFPEIFEGSDLSDWLTLFESLDLIIVHGGRVLLSTPGRLFIGNRVANGRVCVCG